MHFKVICTLLHEQLSMHTVKESASCVYVLGLFVYSAMYKAEGYSWALAIACALDPSPIKTQELSNTPVCSCSVLLSCYKPFNPNPSLALCVTVRPQIILQKLFSSQVEYAFYFKSWMREMVSLSTGGQWACTQTLHSFHQCGLGHLPLLVVWRFKIQAHSSPEPLCFAVWPLTPRTLSCLWGQGMKAEGGNKTYNNCYFSNYSESIVPLRVNQRGSPLLHTEVQQGTSTQHVTSSTPGAPTGPAGCRVPPQQASQAHKEVVCDKLTQINLWQPTENSKGRMELTG